jgi:hypothetical protein
MLAQRPTSYIVVLHEAIKNDPYGGSAILGRYNIVEEMEGREKRLSVYISHN